MDWIDIKDKSPPQDGTPFLGYDPNSQFEKATIYVLVYSPATNYSDEGYLEAGGECYFKWEITHWMPLPKPPEQ